MSTPKSHFYADTLRTLVRFAIAMALLGILVGIAYQESAQKLTYETTGAGLRLAAVLPLALVHGHIFAMGVLLPLSLGCAMELSLKAGGKLVGRIALTSLRRVFLPFVCASVALQMFKGYFVLLAVRNGQQDLAAVDASFLAGSHTLRFALYAIIHSGVGISLSVFLLALWRSMGMRTVK